MQEGPWMWLEAAERGTMAPEGKGSSSEGILTGDSSLAVPQLNTK